MFKENDCLEIALNNSISPLQELLSLLSLELRLLLLLLYLSYGLSLCVLHVALSSTCSVELSALPLDFELFSLCLARLSVIAFLDGISWKAISELFCPCSEERSVNPVYFESEFVGGVSFELS